jgi:uroporphyrin-III C-methyltransferase
VPGVTAAFAAGAALQLPLTDRKSASKLIFCTGHHATGKDETPIWTGPLPEDATLVVYMPGRDMTRLARELAAAGVAADMPCCAISHAATERQSHAAATLEELPGIVCGPAPLLLLIGRAMASLLCGSDADAVAAGLIASATAELHKER